MAQAVTVGPHAPRPSLPLGRCWGWCAGGRVGWFHTAVSLLIMSNMWCLFASRIVCTCYHAHPGLLLALKKKKQKNQKTQLEEHIWAILLESTTTPPPPKDSDLTGILGGWSSNCLMKMNEENCWYQDHAGAPSPGCWKCDGISSLHLSVSYLG